ncbi:short-chain dehydrogenase/oxidoreductase [Stipitochalara longipes BDJ]|nr:short-chain dehydrogenase/oxidoreductase [Stipitochalara longipes BDJ]
MSFPYKTVLVLGATSGIGLALAEKLVENGSHVIVVGRRKQKLESFVSKYGKDKASCIQFDITDLPSIPSFAESSVFLTRLPHRLHKLTLNRVIKDHPTLDSIILNSGIQRPLNFTHPQSIDLDVVESEFTTNYIAPLHLTKAFLPFLQLQSSPTSLIFTTSGLALTPILRCGNYCASKAALHHLILVLREQLNESNVKVVEILPPAVQTELHDAKHQPDIKDGGSFGMPLEEFTEECWTGLVQGKENVPVGMVKKQWEWEEERSKRFGEMVKAMRGGK